MASDYVRWLSQYDVRWSWEHVYEHQTQPGIHAILVNGQAINCSHMVPGQTILIRDQLSPRPDQLWIHDRGLDSITGERNVPYVLQRVVDVIGGTDAADRYNRTIESPGRHGRAFPTSTAGPQRQFMSNTAVILRVLFDAQTAATMFNTLFTS